VCIALPLAGASPHLHHVARVPAHPGAGSLVLHVDRALNDGNCFVVVVEDVAVSVVAISLTRATSRSCRQQHTRIVTLPLFDVLYCGSSPDVKKVLAGTQVARTTPLTSN